MKVKYSKHKMIIDGEEWVRVATDYYGLGYNGTDLEDALRFTRRELRDIAEVDTIEFEHDQSVKCYTMEDIEKAAPEILKEIESKL